jgi:DNA repair exonuclease SbcCD ATPase subunit
MDPELQAAIARGDVLPEDIPTPAGEDGAADEVKNDPEVKELEAELDKGDKPDAKADAKEGDEPADGDDPKEGDKPAKDSRIPASRHKEILEKERAKTKAAQEELAALKAREAEAERTTTAVTEFTEIENQISTFEDEYAELLSDGDIKGANAVMKKIRQAERYMSDAKADLKVQQAALVAAENTRYQAALSRIENAFPALNPDHDDYDQKTEARVIRLSQANQAGGMTPVAALQDAVEAILGVDTPAQEKATTKADKSGERKAAAVDKTLKAVKGTPPSTTKLGLDSDKMGGGRLDAAAVIKLPAKEFAKLSEADLALLRGDVI